MNNEVIKRVLMRAKLIEQQIYFYTNLQETFGNMVDGLYGLAHGNEADGFPIEGFIDCWSSLEGVYASIHYVRDFHTPEETPIVCGALVDIIKLLRSYREKFITKFTHEEVGDIVGGLEEYNFALPPMVLTDITKRSNLRLLIELERSIYFYSERRIPIDGVLACLQKVMRDLQFLSIEEFLNVMNGLRDIIATLGVDCKKHTFEQTATICKYILESIVLIQEYKKTYLIFP